MLAACMGKATKRLSEHHERQKRCASFGEGAVCNVDALAVNGVRGSGRANYDARHPRGTEERVHFLSFVVRKICTRWTSVVVPYMPPT